MEYKVIVVGIGPGSPDYILPIASKTIEQATVIVGSKRAIESFAPKTAKQKIIDKDIQGVLNFIAENLVSSNVVVMVSGDPGYYSLLLAIKTKFSNEKIEVIPGISSMQLAFARINNVWQDACLISMHGRSVDKDRLAFTPQKKLSILTDNDNLPCNIAKLLVAGGWPLSSKVWLCTSLSYDNEEIRHLTLEEVLEVPGYSHCVMVVKA